MPGRCPAGEPGDQSGGPVGTRLRERASGAASAAARSEAPVGALVCMVIRRASSSFISGLPRPAPSRPVCLVGGFDLLSADGKPEASAHSQKQVSEAQAASICGLRIRLAGFCGAREPFEAASSRLKRLVGSQVLV
jgi:hypothetical protein